MWKLPGLLMCILLLIAALLTVPEVDGSANELSEVEHAHFDIVTHEGDIAIQYAEDAVLAFEHAESEMYAAHIPGQHSRDCAHVAPIPLAGVSNDEFIDGREALCRIKEGSVGSVSC